MWGKVKQIRRRTLVLVPVVALVILGSGIGITYAALSYAERHPVGFLELLGARTAAPGLLIIAHRGASDEAPENTIAAFRKAIEIGADGVECDVVFTRDDVPVIIHDDDLGMHKVKQPGVNIKDLTLEQVKQLDVGSWFSKEFAGERVPTLDEGLAFLHGKVARVYLHDKETNDYAGPKRERIRTFAQVIRDNGMADRAVVMIAGENDKDWKELAPDIHTLHCWLVKGAEDRINQLEGYGSPRTTYFGIHDLFPKGFNWLGLWMIDHEFHHVGYIFGLWPTRSEVAQYKTKPCDFVIFTIDDEFKMLLYSYRKFDAIGTDKPRLLLSVLSRPVGKRKGPAELQTTPAQTTRRVSPDAPPS